jgi:nicotinamidase/pyrazinamidase
MSGVRGPNVGMHARWRWRRRRRKSRLSVPDLAIVYGTQSTDLGSVQIPVETSIMLEGPLVFVDIDTQHDFLDVTGALYVSGSADILPNLQRLTQFARARHIPTIATSCAHEPDDPELKIFPPHCMAGSAGQERVPATACAESVVLEVDDRLTAEIPAHLTLFKRELDVFGRADADEIFERYQQRKPTFVVYGVATDYCVRAAVLGLLERKYRVAIVADAVRAIDQAAESTILTDFARRGGLMTLTEIVCSGSPV